MVQQSMDLETAVTAKPTRQLDDERCQHIFIRSALWDMPLHRAMLTENLTRLSF